MTTQGRYIAECQTLLGEEAASSMKRLGGSIEALLRGASGLEPEMQGTWLTFLLHHTGMMFDGETVTDLTLLFLCLLRDAKDKGRRVKVTIEFV